MDGVIVSQEARLWRGKTDTWVTVKLLMAMTHDEWEQFAQIKYPGYRVLELTKTETIHEDKNYGC